jgi:hypothetical protein
VSFPKYKHDPDSNVDYSVDWTDWLADTGGDTIASAQWIVPTDLTASNESHTTTAATVWLSGGTVGTDYTVVSRITTVDGRIEDQSIILKCQEL